MVKNQNTGDDTPGGGVKAGNDPFRRVKWDKRKELTESWVGRVINTMTRELRHNVGERTQHALRKRFAELHELGLKTEQIETIGQPLI